MPYSISWQEALAGEMALSQGDVARAEPAFQAARYPVGSSFSIETALVSIGNNLPFRDGLARVRAARGQLTDAMKMYRQLNEPDITSTWISMLEPRFVLAVARLAARTGDTTAASRIPEISAAVEGRRRGIARARRGTRVHLETRCRRAVRSISRSADLQVCPTRQPRGAGLKSGATGTTRAPSRAGIETDWREPVTSRRGFSVACCGAQARLRLEAAGQLDQHDARLDPRRVASARMRRAASRPLDAAGLQADLPRMQRTDHRRCPRRCRRHSGPPWCGHRLSTARNRSPRLKMAISAPGDDRRAPFARRDVVARR